MAGFSGIRDAASVASIGEPGPDAMHSGPETRLHGGLQRETNLMASGVINGDPSREGSLGIDRAAAETRILRLSPSIARLPVEMTVAVPIRTFRVRDLLSMVSGALIETQWASGEDLPLASGVVQLAWSEFEVVDTRLAVRVTRLG